MDEAAARAAFDTALGSYKQEFGTFFLARLFGLEITYEKDACLVRFPVRDFAFNPQGSLHGGVAAFAMDISMGHLLKHTYGVQGATLEIKVQYLRPIREPECHCRGVFLGRGRSLCFLESRLYDATGELCAVATSTWKVGTAKPA
jgi:uncharacterized protein (TIGR00369 family)